MKDDESVRVDRDFIDQLSFVPRLKWWVASWFPCRWVFGRKMCSCGPQGCKRS